MSCAVVNTPLGHIKITFDDLDDAVIGITETDEPLKQPVGSVVLSQLCFQLREYFETGELSFRGAVKYSGTPFQCAVWEQCARIKPGETVTYSGIARAIGRPKAVRAVGGALNRNPLLFLIPCHRVVAQNGLGGFRLGLEAKKFLLDLEKNDKF